MEHVLGCFLQVVILLSITVTLILGADYVNRHTDSTAMRVCQIEHSYDTCFSALNR